MRYLKLFVFILIGYGLNGCGGSEESQKSKMEEFATVYALVVPSAGQTTINDSSPIAGPRLLQPGDRVTVIKGKARLIHENGSRIEMKKGGVVNVHEFYPGIVKGSVMVEFPAGINSRIKFGDWSINGKNSVIQLNTEDQTIYNFEGAAVVENSRDKFMVRAGNKLILGKEPKVEPVKWLQNSNQYRMWKDQKESDLIEGQGVLGARSPGSSGKAHLPLVNSSMKIKVNIIGDMAVTSITQEFYNPHGSKLEGIYRFKSPKGAIINGFAVDRGGKLVFGHIKEKIQAKQTYQKHVYATSTKQPALLEYEAENRYKAYIFPIKAGSTRKVFIRYTTWLDRYGDKQQYRHYTLPLLGYDQLSPEYGNFELEVNLDRTNSFGVKANLGVSREKQKLVLKKSDYQSTANFYLELEDSGVDYQVAQGWYGRPPGRKLPKVRRGDNFLLRLSPFGGASGADKNLDLVVLVDVSGDISSYQLSLARHTVESLADNLLDGDRIAIVSGDLVLRKKTKFITAGQEIPDEMLENLARVEKGGATDIAELLKETAETFSQTAEGNIPVLLYIGNGRPTVGELTTDEVAKKWFNLPYFFGFKAIATNKGEGFELLRRLCNNDEPLVLSDPETLSVVPDFINSFRKKRIKHASLAFDEEVSSSFPSIRDEFEIESGKTLNISGILASENLPEKITLKGEYEGEAWKKSFKINWSRFSNVKELGRRYGYEKMAFLSEKGAGSDVLMDLSLRYGLVSPYASFYVPTIEEARREGLLTEDNEVNVDEILVKKDKAQTEASNGIESEEKMADKTRAADQKTAPRSVSKSSQRAPTGSAKKESKPRSRSGRKPRKKSASSKGTKALKKFDKTNQGAAPGSSGSNKNTGRQDEFQGIDGGGGLGGKFGKRRSGRKRKTKVKEGKVQILSDKDMPAPTGRTAVAPRDKRKQPAKKYLDEQSRQKLVKHYQKAINSIRQSGLGEDVKNKLIKRMQDKLRKYVNSNLLNKQSDTSSTKFGYFNLIQSKETKIFCYNCHWQRKPEPCSATSKLPLWRRKYIWRERMGNPTSADKVMEIYVDAANACELPTPHSKTILLRQAIRRLPKVDNLIALYKKFTPRYGFNKFFRSAILAKVSSISELLRVKKFLGLGKTAYRSKIKEVLDSYEDHNKKIKVLADFIKKLKVEDPWLKIKLLKLYEKHNKEDEAFRLINTFYSNPLLDEELRLTAVEYLKRRNKSDQARRLLSEIVEFSVKDPSRRKILGSLFRGFGWYEFAVREFISLVKLTRDSNEAKLKLATAYADLGSNEKALLLIQEVMTKADPGSNIVGLARITASLILAKLRYKANKSQKANIIAKANKMAILRDDESYKVFLVTRHPSADLELLWNRPGQSRNRVLLVKPEWGLQSIVVEKLPEKLEFVINRQNPDSIRVLSPELFIILNEGKKDEKIIYKKFKFERGIKSINLDFADREIKNLEIKKSETEKETAK
ncbi:MAG: VIT domain-containing protein [Myxococcota bacterium]